ncbi:MAG TPA: GIY-YIG nuclease family protein [Gemmatimonadales bacterium]|nr:GIY-YIG nuclease family protein [Gemmatimonadales bacterium]
MARQFYAYILASRSRVLYVGVTNDLARRLAEHRSGAIPGFTRRYQVHRLVHFEVYCDPGSAIAREKQLKGWVRHRKVELVERANPEWRELGVTLGLAPAE